MLHKIIAHPKEWLKTINKFNSNFIIKEKNE